MRNILFGLFFPVLLLPGRLAAVPPAAPLRYEVNLNDRADDQFKVTLRVDGLKPENAVYQFAATAPGTYQVMDIGRFVRTFKAFDKRGRELKTQQISTNQWKIDKPRKVREIRYTVAETWDTPVKEHPIYGMCGTSMERDHVLINGQGVFGFPTGMQFSPLEVKLSYPAEWQVGTALEKNADGSYQARSYDHIVDSPILLGRLTKAVTDVAGAKVEVYTYSKTDQIKSEQLLSNMQAMLTAAGTFLKELPVKRYAFLYHFEDKSAGAWEHSYSSEYVLQEAELTKAYADQVTSIAAHEFFHIVTPLNIHSEVIEHFNFVTPTPSEHLWLYEGVTEWASHIMQLRGNLVDLPGYLDDVSSKIAVDKKMDTTYSLSKLGLTCYTPEGQQQYYNIYNRGALVAGLLDIRLLELSGGRRGLREVVNELARTYGPNKSFPEKEFYDIFVRMTYPEIGDFFERYVKNAEPLPFAEYYGKLGIRYAPLLRTGKTTADLGFQLKNAGGKLLFAQLKAPLQTAGLRVQDELTAFNGEPVNLDNIAAVGGQLQGLKAGESYQFTVRRDGKEVTVPVQVLEQEEIKPYAFEPDPQATPAQLALREAWAKNL
ncbi:MAG TPA: PDZ domain-containing protein [Cytophagales bacterium]